MERLQEELDSLLAQLPEEPEIRDRLNTLVSVYPFNEYEYIIATLLARDVLIDFLKIEAITSWYNKWREPGRNSGSRRAVVASVAGETGSWLASFPGK